MVSAKIENNHLVVSVPLCEQISRSGKNLIVASTYGNIPLPLQYKGKIVTVGVNAYIPKE